MCPEIYFWSDELDMYGMELLNPDPVMPTLLQEIEQTLVSHVWERPPVYYQSDWLSFLNAKITIPPPPPFVTSPCLTHGDCTASNAMRRGSQLILIDPLPQRDHVVSAREADMGRILQSAFGWETVCYGDAPIMYDPPAFWFRGAEQKLALWWCAATLLRILLQERAEKKRPNVIAWCEQVAEVCIDASRV